MTTKKAVKKEVVEEKKEPVIVPEDKNAPPVDSTK